MCGEKSMRPYSASASAGSPPRVRGKADVMHNIKPDRGITPACAGKRKTARHCLEQIQDHPRVCGEKAGTDERRYKEAGSPPRVRGKASRSVTLSVTHRITPACAGKSPTPHHRHSIHGDHPRVCGEKQSVNIIIPHCWGSPPRVRGKGPAGHNTDGRSMDHPRVCGEKTKESLKK